MEIGMGWMSTAASVDRYMLLGALGAGCWAVLGGVVVVVGLVVGDVVGVVTMQF